MDKRFVLGGSIVALLVIAALFAWRAERVGNTDRALYERVQDQPAMAALYEKAMGEEAYIKKHPDDVVKYFAAGLSWKSIAEQMEGSEAEREPFFRRSLATYERGIEKFGRKNILFYLNAGKVAERLGDFGKAERYFKKVIEIAPGEENGYLSLVDLYSYRMNKSKEEVVLVFEQGTKAMVDPTLIVVGRASYLRRIGDAEGALKDYEILAAKFPSREGFKTIVSELKAILQQ